jgi:hypothetical protein
MKFGGKCSEETTVKLDKKISPHKVKKEKVKLYRPLLKLCRNDCFGVEKIFEQ